VIFTAAGRRSAVLRVARETGPALLVPAAWAVVAAAHVDVVADRTLLIAHAVMTTLLVVFAVTGRADMREGTLRVWWVVIAVGVVPAAAGTAGLAAGNAALRAVALYGWMLLPAVGLVDTGRRVSRASVRYLGGAVLCVIGAAVHAVAGALPVATSTAAVAGVAVVGAGQSAGILDAVLRY